MTDETRRAVEAVLFAADAPMTVAEIRAYAGDEVDVRAALDALVEDYSARGIHLVKRGE
jgi:segregation and condensation protein B